MNGSNTVENFWIRSAVVMLSLVMICLSSDLRLGLTLRLGTKPDFQLFELATFVLGAVFLCTLPRVVLHSRFVPAREDMLLFLFIVHAVLTSFLAADPLHSISRAKDFLVCGFLYAFARYGLLDRSRLDKLLYFFTGLACFWSLIGIWQWMGLDKDYGGDLYKLFLARQALYKSVVDISAGDVVKSSFAHGLYLYPQNFIYYLMVPFAVSVGVARRRPAVWLVSAIIFAAMVGTLSKTFLLLLVLSGGYWLLRKITGNRAVALTALVAAGTLVVLPILLLGDARFWTRALGTFIWRLEIWSDAFRMLREQPLILLSGHGTELLRDLYSREHYPNPHNMFLYFLIEYGVVGFALFFSFLALSVRHGASLLRVDAGEIGPHWQPLFAGMVFFLSMGIVDDIFVQTQMDGLVLLFLGFLARAADSVGTVRNADSGNERNAMVAGRTPSEADCNG